MSSDPIAEPQPRSDRPPGPSSALGVTVIALTLALDQATKWAADAWLVKDQVIDILPILALYLTYNPGIAFSMFESLGTLPLILGTAAITIGVLVFWQRTREGGALAAIGFALIIGGAVGNLVDRLVQGHVVDFLMLHTGERVLFVFNLADVALTLGPISLILAYILPSRRPA